MKGFIALVGAGEYLPVMDEVDRHLLDSLHIKGRTPRVVCIPTAAGQEGDASIDRWLNMGVAHFEALGAEVTPARIIDQESANASQWETAIEGADLIYFSGGNPMYLHETMRGSRAWDAAKKAWARGAIYAGCSAGAMILANKIPNLRSAGLTSQEAFNIFPATFVIPHFDKMRGFVSAYLFAVRKQLKAGQFIVGIDEDTALVGKLGDKWQVMGAGKVYLITRKEQQDFIAGQEISLTT